MCSDDLKKYLGIDWGSKRIGLSLGDSITKVASPFCVVKNLAEVLDLIKKEDINEIVLGKPVKMSGQDTNLTEEFERFLKKLENQIKIPIHLIDERLSSLAADSLPGTKKTKASRDAVAAMIILQSYFDKN